MPSGRGDIGLKTLKELQVEHDEEERFQADIKTAVRQSLGIIFILSKYVVLLLLVSACSCMTPLYFVFLLKSNTKSFSLLS